MIEEKKISVDNLEVNYKIAGEGFPFLILHGWGGSSNSWVNVQKILANQGYQVIALDLPGFGKTPSPETPWGVNDYTNFVLKFVDKLDFKKIILLGHSFGGRMAIKFSRYYPEKVESLILCASAGVKIPATFLQKVIYVLARTGNFLFSPKLLRRFKDVARNFFYTIIRQRDYKRAKGTMRETFKKIVTDDLVLDLPEIKARTLIVWGERDKAVPTEAAYLIKEKVPNSILEFIPGVTHTPNLEAPEKLSAVILNFLKNKN
jgi:pimeloyl-ACP methyl ester carboxylesterase